MVSGKTVTVVPVLNDLPWIIGIGLIDEEANHLPIVEHFVERVGIPAVLELIKSLVCNLRLYVTVLLLELLDYLLGVAKR
jgi:hypothetical protein